MEAPTADSVIRGQEGSWIEKGSAIASMGGPRSAHAAGAIN